MSNLCHMVNAQRICNVYKSLYREKVTLIEYIISQITKNFLPLVNNKQDCLISLETKTRIINDTRFFSLNQNRCLWHFQRATLNVSTSILINKVNSNLIFKPMEF